MASPSQARPSIPILLLKTRSQPYDAYEEYFTTPTTSTAISTSRLGFRPEFIPVLEHRPRTENLRKLEKVLRSRTLDEAYGGMIFTSQRAVEEWAHLVKQTELEADADDVSTLSIQGIQSGRPASNTLPHDDTPFPLYTVGPATARALTTLVSESNTVLSSPFARVKPQVLGAHTGNGATLATYIRSHYHLIHSHRYFTFHEAPRLPFIPLLGPPQGERIDKADPRLRKKPLLFLVGETRRDVIPKTLMDPENKLDPDDRIQVDELEVYGTDVMEGFGASFRSRIDAHTEEEKDRRASPVVVVVLVFSPQGCEAMLRSLGFIDEDSKLTERGRMRWREEQDPPQTPKYVIVTIGPTTRDHLKDKFDFDADVCAKKPSPEGVGEALKEFLSEKGYGGIVEHFLFRGQ